MMIPTTCDILLTNDDGYDAIGFYPLLKLLAKKYAVVVVAPDSQRSWQAKSISKKNDLQLVTKKLHEFEVFALNGTPADCVQIGLHDVLQTRPKLVVSGINAGSNAGRGRTLSSGTVGAGFEAALNGVKAVAASLFLQMTPAEYKAVSFTDPAFYHLFEPAAAIMAELIDKLIEVPLPDDIDVVSVNIPLKATIATPREVTTLANDGYGQIFVKRDDFYVHHSASYDTDQPKPGTDTHALSEGHVAITPLSLDLSSHQSLDFLNKVMQ